MKHFLEPIRFLLLTLMSLGFLTSTAHASQVLYRYINDKGVKVLNSSIPPEYSQKGYEVISISGKVLKVVPPAPTARDIAQQEENRQVLEQYEMLRRRYSSVNDIEAAKRRRLANIDTNISILRGNISGVKTHIDNLMSQAANAERAGRDVPQDLLQELADARAELSVAQELLDIRLEEYRDVTKKFDTDVAWFIKGDELQKGQVIR